MGAPKFFILIENHKIFDLTRTYSMVLLRNILHLEGPLKVVKSLKKLSTGKLFLK